jgi:hypothetical protein
MNPKLKLPMAVAVLAVALIGCGQQAQSPSTRVDAGSPSPSTPAMPSPAPTASDAAVAAAPGEFTVCIPLNQVLRAGTDEEIAAAHPDGDMAGERQRGYTWSGTHTATDDRFSGTHYYSWDGDSYTLASGADGPGVAAEGLRIENDEGAWQGSGATATLPDGTVANSPLVMTGEGAYEGMTAALLWVDGPCFLDLRGIVIEFPEPPVPATTAEGA